MTFPANLALWQAIGAGIDAEDARVGLLVSHNESRGVAREAILRDLLIRQTPEPYRVTTGFLCHADAKRIDHSSQCDVLVYDPRIGRPYYEISAFAVVPRDAARVIAEVKTTLDTRAIEDIFAKSRHPAGWNPVPMFGFAFDGVSFDTAMETFGRCMKEDPAAPVQCVAVHRANYVIIRTDDSYCVGFWYHGESARALATGLFMRDFDGAIRGNPRGSRAAFEYPGGSVTGRVIGEKGDFSTLPRDPESGKVILPKLSKQ
jgi:hypothetical protein